MTYNVFGGTLSLTQPSTIEAYFFIYFCFPITLVILRHYYALSIKPHVGPGHPTFPLFPILHLLPHLLLFLHFTFSFIGFTYFLFLSIPSLSTRIVPLRFQAGGRRKRPNLGLVCCV